MRRLLLSPVPLVFLASTYVFACSASGANGGGFTGGGGGGGGGGGDNAGGGGGGFVGAGGGGGQGAGFGGGNGGGAGGAGGGGQVTITIYAHSDSELYTMDPTSHQVTDVGPFQLSGGGAVGGAVTDLAVDSNDNVFVNTETAIYSAALPAKTGPVTLTLVTQITGSSSKFYALGFAPAGVLGSGEGLVAGDGNGELWYIDTSSANATPQDLGGFGTDANGNQWELSGDVVFYTQNNTPTGLATIRTYCSNGCSQSNDSLAAIDMTALGTAYTSKTPAATLLKGTYGNGSGFGDLYGIGAWGNDVFAFARASNGAPAQLVQIDQTGTGTSLQTFSNITKGWSGAGVTTKTQVSIPPPPPR